MEESQSHWKLEITLSLIYIGFVVGFFYFAQKEGKIKLNF